jgi:hypothetical protein
MEDRILMSRDAEDSRRYPSDSWDYDHYEEALYVLYGSKKDGKPHVPTFARRLLRELREEGLLHRPDIELTNVRKVRVGERELWLRLDTRRSDEGYMAVDLVNAPQSDAAIIAAMFAYLAPPMSFEVFVEARRFDRSSEKRALEGRRDVLSKKMDKGETEWDDLIEIWNIVDDLQTKAKPLLSAGYLYPLLEFYKPEVIDYSGEQIDEILKKAFHYVNNFLEALRELQAFLEYGAPNRKLIPSIREPGRDIRAAVLRDVHGLKLREVGESLGIRPSPSDEIKGDAQTVSDAVKRGRRILEEAFAEEGGWQVRARAMKVDMEWWDTLSGEERYKEIQAQEIASSYGLPIEEARRRV